MKAIRANETCAEAPSHGTNEELCGAHNILGCVLFVQWEVHVCVFPCVRPSVPDCLQHEAGRSLQLFGVESSAHIPGVPKET